MAPIGSVDLSKLNNAQQIAILTGNFQALSASEMSELSQLLSGNTVISACPANQDVSTLLAGQAPATSQLVDLEKGSAPAPTETPSEIDVDQICKEKHIPLNDFNRNIIRKYLEQGNTDYSELGFLSANIQDEKTAAVAEKMLETPGRFEPKKASAILQNVRNGGIDMQSFALDLIDLKNPDDTFMFNPDNIGDILLTTSCSSYNADKLDYKMQKFTDLVAQKSTNPNSKLTGDTISGIYAAIEPENEGFLSLMKYDQFSSEDIVQLMKTYNLKKDNGEAIDKQQLIQSVLEANQIEQDIQQRYNIRSEFGAYPKTAGMVDEVLGELREKGFDIGLSEIEICPPLYARGMYDYKDKSITFTGKLEGEMDAAHIAAIDNRDEATENQDDELYLTNPKRTIIHEFGHYLQHKQTGFTNFEDMPTSENFYQKEVQSSIERSVSSYAASDPKEFVAEVFAGLMLGKTFPEDIMQLYKELQGPPVPQTK